MSVIDQFAGVWRLVSFEERGSDGEVSYPYGKDAVGLLFYDASRKMSVQIMRRDRAALSSEDWRALAPDEIKSTVEGFTAFFGSYEIDESASTIIHHVEGHLLPSSVGKRLKRAYQFSGDRLILKPSENRRVVWERVA